MRELRELNSECSDRENGEISGREKLFGEGVVFSLVTHVAKPKPKPKWN